MDRRVFRLWGAAALLYVLLAWWNARPIQARFLFPAADTLSLDPLYISESGQVVRIPGLDGTGFSEEMEPTENGYLYPAGKDGLWGYVSADGRWQIEPRYQKAGPFCENRAQVALSENRMACIDPQGQVLYSWSNALSFLSGDKRVGRYGDGIALRYQATGQPTVYLDFLDLQGQVIAAGIPVDAACLEPELFFGDGDGAFYRETLCFSERLLPASLNGKYGYLNSAGQWVIEPVYEAARPFSEGLAAVCREGKYGYIDQSGNEVIPCRYERAQPFREGLAAVKPAGGAEYAWQLVHPDGSAAFALEHRCFPAEIGPDTLVFHEGLCCARQADGWIYYDRAGTPVLTVDTWIAGPFRNGLACVQDNQYACAYIDARGNRVYQWDGSFVWELNALMNQNARLLGQLFRGLLSLPPPQTPGPAAGGLYSPVS